MGQNSARSEMMLRRRGNTAATSSHTVVGLSQFYISGQGWFLCVSTLLSFYHLFTTTPLLSTILRNALSHATTHLETNHGCQPCYPRS